jgi:S1-C subfamily serine protease
MGEAKRRGTLDERVQEALRRSSESGRIKESAQLGITPSNLFVARLSNGHLFEPASVVQPIIRLTQNGRSFEVIGTGFFVSHGILATARHVIEVALRPDGQCDPLFCLHIRSDGDAWKWNFRAVVEAVAHKESDVGLCKLETGLHVTTGQQLPNPILRLSERSPAVGDRVFTYAYPDCVVQLNEDQVTAHLNPHYYAGAIDEDFPKGRDSVILPWPCFQTSMHVHAGASGGPVFDSSGAVFGINTSSFDSQTDISYVSKVAPLFDLPIKDYLNEEGRARTATLRELANIGFARIDVTAA